MSNNTDLVNSNINPIDVLDKELISIDKVLTKSYLQNLSNSPIVPYYEEFANKKLSGIRWFRIDNIVYEQGVFFIDKFSMFLNSLHSEAQEVLLLLNKSKGSRVSLYIGARDFDSSNNYYSGETLKSSLKGFFPGVKMEQEKPDEFISFENKAISSVSAVASLRDENKENFAQGLERLINATTEISDFTAIMIAENVSEKERKNIIAGYNSMYTMISPFASTQVSTNKEMSKSISKGESEAISDTITKGVTRTISHGSNTSSSITNTKGENQSKTSTHSGTIFGGLYIPPFTGGLSYGYSKGNTKGTSSSKSIANTSGTSTTKSNSDNESESKGITKSTNTGESWTEGEGQTITINYENKTISHLLEQIDKQIERIDSNGVLGMWNFATYIISKTNTTSKLLSNIYKGCVLGEESNFELTAINTWEKERISDINALAMYLCNFVHPRFFVDTKYNVSAGALVNSKDLAIHLALPQSSVPGVLVQERVSFGREVFLKDQERPFLLGNTYHLGVEEKTPIHLDLNSFSKHVFVTGSTGSGKSNTVYHLLDNLMNPEDGKDPIKVLVIEPAKGEYKQIVKDAHVYGTNPDLSDLLRINPFVFPDGIRVEEHIDRLIEIFNVCWPMYAAMPAVLKESVLRAYESSGWDLLSSKPKYKGVYPNFADVLMELKTVIRSSEYSSEAQGNYIGALETRLRSLTNGINSHIFSNNNYIPDEDLFDRNVVVDLSRVGSSETKSLIMGILMLKLSEYRMSSAAGKINQELKHVTILEEAHNLLKRTSKEQSQEGSNLQGKSVEMIANAIAEMRTYGEGFIIVDQSPTAVDEAAIKNTNTKIIMSLPDGNDREIVGKSVGLKDEQIEEISRMPVGVAIVYQSNWSEAVMCKIKKYDTSNISSYSYKPDYLLEDKELDIDIVSFLLLANYRGVNIDNIEEKIMSSSMCAIDKCTMMDMIIDYNANDEAVFIDLWPSKVRASILSNYVDCNKKIEKICKEVEYKKIDSIYFRLKNAIPNIISENGINKDHFLDYILLSEYTKNKELDSFYNEWALFLKNNK